MLEIGKRLVSWIGRSLMRMIFKDKSPMKLLYNLNWLNVLLGWLAIFLKAQSLREKRLCNKAYKNVTAERNSIEDLIQKVTFTMKVKTFIL